MVQLIPKVAPKRGSAWMAALVLTFGAATSASAQQGEASSGESSTSGGSSSEAASSKESADDSASSGTSSKSSGKASKGPDPGDPHYWARVRKVRTVQKREFQKVNRFAATVYGGVIPNNIFETYFPIGIRLDYFILENIGIEVAGSRSFESSTSLKGTLREPNGINASSIKVADSQIWHTNVGILWSPSYGKAAFYESKIGYFDLYLFGGAGMVVTATPKFPNQPEDEEPTTIKAEGVLGAGFAWYLNNHLAVRTDFRQFLFRKNPDVGGVANPSEISVGGTWLF